MAPKLRIVARCIDEREQTKIRRAGADAVVLPNMIGGMRMVSEMVRPHVVTFLDVMLRDKERRLRVEEVPVPADSPLGGTTVGQLHARKIKDLLVVALREADGTWRYNPEEHERMNPGMTIVFMGSPEARTALERLLLR
jgi:voltage-gated potassium channel